MLETTFSCDRRVNFDVFFPLNIRCKISCEMV